ncbi:Putative SOS response-associated peptidase YedK [Corynebacterium kalinowskii]|uniref:Abasic site processing protein n=1 Tax=Corynebacterium kalinowskii TaxID=2675216 RepID=A0A6B8VES6_9CORY|nr:SOS response-associated peptidase [Corynebacterium kalinowskii]QGU02673.1 Putative SOS response-associated peptidase YedK [Corynebacterium kalinowskii]
MCGRFVLFTTGESLLRATAELIDDPTRPTRAPHGAPPPRYNIAPTNVIPIVRFLAEETLLEPARWGLLPHWKKDLTGAPLFNARAETIAEKPSFRDAYKRGRCVIPLDGYYEWHEKKPYFVRPADGGMLWAAGLWATGLDQLSATMVTTDSVAPLDWLHHRLPRFLTREEVAPWLTGATDLLHPSPAHLVSSLVTSPADPAVGNVRNDYPELISDQVS